MPNREPIRCFEGNAKPHEPFWRLRNADETGGEPEMELYGYISEYAWLDDDITPQLFKDDLLRLGNGGPITLRINSGGGDMIAASVMRAIMTEYPGRITARIDGLAASAAVLVAMSAENIRIQDSAYMMIHDPSLTVFMATLDIETLSRLLDLLKTAKKGIVDVYAAKTGISLDRLTKMMADETWMSAREAVDLGFAQEVIPGGNGGTGAAQNRALLNALRNYQHVPPALLREDRRDAEPPPQPESPELRRLRAELALDI